MALSYINNKEIKFGSSKPLNGVYTPGSPTREYEPLDSLGIYLNSGIPLSYGVENGRYMSMSDEFAATSQGNSYSFNQFFAAQMILGFKLHDRFIACDTEHKIIGTEPLLHKAYLAEITEKTLDYFKIKIYEDKTRTFCIRMSSSEVPTSYVDLTNSFDENGLNLTQTDRQSFLSYYRFYPLTARDPSSRSEETLGVDYYLLPSAEGLKELSRDILSKFNAFISSDGSTLTSLGNTAFAYAGDIDYVPNYRGETSEAAVSAAESARVILGQVEEMHADINQLRPEMEKNLELTKQYRDEAMSTEIGTVREDLNQLKGDLDNYLSLPTYTDVELTKVKDMVYDSETNTFSYLSGFAYADLTVSEGEEYLITGWNSGYKYCPTFLNENTVVSVIEHVGSYENLAVIVPPNANRLVINERTNNINCKAQKLQINEKSKEFLSDYEKTKSSIVDKLDNNFMVFVEQEIAIVSNRLTNINTLEKDTLSSFQTAEISVVAGEKYKISATNVSGIYPACFFCDADNNTTVAFAYTGVDVEVIVPTNATKMFINARVTVQPIIVKKYVKAETSDSFWEDYYSLHNMVKTIDPVKLTPPHIGVKYTGDGINVFLSNYSENTDLLVRLWKKPGNGLMDFGTFDKVANDSGLVLVEPTEYVRILGGETDFLSPSIVFAVNNIDGDFPDLTDGKLTGGWHTYGGGTDTSKTATARCIKVSVCCDGKPLSVGESARGSEVVVEITNRLQGSNTEKADGTGREIVEQHFKIVFSDGFRIRIDGEITALEDIKYRTYYGVSADLIDNAPFRFVGCRATRQERLPSASVYRCNDKYCTGIVQKSEQDTFELGFDPTIDLGTQFANKWLHSCITGSGKAYMVLISGGTENNDLELSSGDKIYWRGYYEMYPTR